MYLRDSPKAKLPLAPECKHYGDVVYRHPLDCRTGEEGEEEDQGVDGGGGEVDAEDPQHPVGGKTIVCRKK